MSKHTSHSLEETAQIADQWLGYISAKHNRMDSGMHWNDTKTGATLVGLSGHLGAGKTAFTKVVAKILGVTEDITSPTFVIMKLYDITAKQKDGTDFSWKKLVHIDAYRLERGQELSALNFESLVADANNLILIEWPENVKKEVEKVTGYEQITFEAGKGENERVMEY